MHLHVSKTDLLYTPKRPMSSLTSRCSMEPMYRLACAPIDDTDLLYTPPSSVCTSSEDSDQTAPKRPMSSLTSRCSMEPMYRLACAPIEDTDLLYMYQPPSSVCTSSEGSDQTTPKRPMSSLWSRCCNGAKV